MSYQQANTSLYLAKYRVLNLILFALKPCREIELRDDLEAFTPPTDLRLGLKDPETAVKQLPLARLPSFLTPRFNKLYYPPVFHLGYAVTLAWAAEYAIKHDLVSLYEEDHLSSDDDTDDDWDSDEYDYDEADEAASPPKDGKLVLDKGAPSLQPPVNSDCTLDDVLNHINANSGTVSLKVTQAKVYPLPSFVSNPLDCWLICVGSNCAARGGALPTPGDLMVLHRYLGLKCPPAWYLDVRECYWKSQRRYSSR